VQEIFASGLYDNVNLRLEERSGGTYQASAGTVYPVLQQLEDEGLVHSREQDGKKIYELTDAGRTSPSRNGWAAGAFDYLRRP
jgi:DNA-binding transcriptional ArsR family regulator